MTFSILSTIEEVIENERTKTAVFSITSSNLSKIENAFENEQQFVTRTAGNQYESRKRGPAPRRKQAPKSGMERAELIT